MEPSKVKLISQSLGTDSDLERFPGLKGSLGVGLAPYGKHV